MPQKELAERMRIALEKHLSIPMPRIVSQFRKETLRIPYKEERKKKGEMNW